MLVLTDTNMRTYSCKHSLTQTRTYLSCVCTPTEILSLSCALALALSHFFLIHLKLLILQLVKPADKTTERTTHRRSRRSTVSLLLLVLPLPLVVVVVLLLYCCCCCCRCSCLSDISLYWWRHCDDDSDGAAVAAAADIVTIISFITFTSVAPTVAPVPQLLLSSPHPSLVHSLSPTSAVRSPLVSPRRVAAPRRCCCCPAFAFAFASGRHASK